MGFLETLNQFNNTAAPQKKEAPKAPSKPEVTFVMTACGRVDLMVQTLDSFLKYNTYPIKRYIITEDSADESVFEQCKLLNQQKYGGKLEFIFNNPKIGQARSIDLAYSTIDTEYVFHCEEDWEFYKSGFIEHSMFVLKADPTILQAWIRPKNDKILNKIDQTIQEIGGIRTRKVLPASFMVKGGGPRGSDLIVKDYMGFSWNPGLKRMSDYKLLGPGGYLKKGPEHSVDGFYRGHKNGFRIVSISANDDEGYVKHIGWGRRAGDPRYGLDDNKKDLETAVKEAENEKNLRDQKLKEEQDKKNQIQSVNKLNPMISIVMQTYLGHYPGARIDSVMKFRRAVESFLLQDYKNAELVIVSDGCEITHNEYLQLYSDIPSIKYVYVSKSGALNMYETVGDKKYYRGTPRRLGVSAASGDIITYMDSDDYLHPSFLKYIVEYHNMKPDADWMINGAWYDHVNIINSAGIDQVLEPYNTNQVLNIPKLGAKFVETKVKKGLIVNTPWLLAHKSHCVTRWTDTFGAISEDVEFGRRLRETYKNGFRYDQPSYFRCHYTGKWDV